VTTFRIGEVAEQVGVTPRTIRYYEELGLLGATESRSKGAHRHYTDADVARLRELIRLRDLLGLSLEELVALVRAHGVALIADVRKMPRSRRHPHFDGATLPTTHGEAGLGYVHLPGLGGLRRASRDSVNRAWRNPSFRGYADYMQTPEFNAAIDDLTKLAEQKRTAVMCAEAVPWRCHRSLIADAFLARGHKAFHIMSAAKAGPHKLTSFAVVREESVHYPG